MIDTYMVYVYLYRYIDIIMYRYYLLGSISHGVIISLGDVSALHLYKSEGLSSRGVYA
jgi:hypothetical protein